jgi:hypothetical protein
VAGTLLRELCHSGKSQSFLLKLWCWAAGGSHGSRPGNRLRLLQGLPPTTQVQVPTPEEATSRRGGLPSLHVLSVAHVLLLITP